MPTRQARSRLEKEATRPFVHKTGDERKNRTTKSEKFGKASLGNGLQSGSIFRSGAKKATSQRTSKISGGHAPQCQKHGMRTVLRFLEFSEISCKIQYGISKKNLRSHSYRIFLNNYFPKNLEKSRLSLKTLGHF